MTPVHSPAAAIAETPRAARVRPSPSGLPASSSALPEATQPAHPTRAIRDRIRGQPEPPCRIVWEVQQELVAARTVASGTRRPASTNSATATSEIEYAGAGSGSSTARAASPSSSPAAGRARSSPSRDPAQLSSSCTGRTQTGGRPVATPK